MNEQNTNQSFNVGNFVTQGWDIFKQNAGGFILLFLLYVVITFVLNLIPVLGQLANLLLSGALSAGVYVVAHKIANSESHIFSNFFDGFQKVGQFIVFALISGLIVLLIALPLGGAALISLLTSGGNMDPTVLVSMAGTLGVMALLIGLIFLFLIYVPCFILFSNYDAINAMKASFNLVKQNIGGHILLALAIIGISLLGVLALGVGIFVAAPVIYLTIYAAWRDQVWINPEEQNIADHLV